MALFVSKESSSSASVGAGPPIQHCKIASDPAKIDHAFQNRRRRRTIMAVYSFAPRRNRFLHTSSSSRQLAAGPVKRWKQKGARRSPENVCLAPTACVQWAVCMREPSNLGAYLTSTFKRHSFFPERLVRYFGATAYLLALL